MFRFKSLGGFILGVALIVSIAVFGGTYFIIYNAIKDVTERRAVEQAKSIARHTFSDMYQIMRKGWSREELLEFLKGVEEAHKNVDIVIRVFRGEKVKALFGEIEEPEKGEEVLRTFRLKEETVSKRGNRLIYAYPLIAKSECLRCHTNVKEGEILGVIEVIQDISRPISAIRDHILVIALFTLPVPVAGALLVVWVITRRLEESLKRLDESIEHVNRVSDLRSIDFNSVSFGFREFEKIKESIARLISKMNRIAVDKDILEFEIRLLEKFVLTSEGVRDWSEFFRRILADLSVKIDFAYFWVIFRGENGATEVYVFWNTFCSQNMERCKGSAEEFLCGKVKELNCNGEEIKFQHIFVSSKVVPYEIEDLPHLSKNLVLSNPPIQVQVGMAVEEAGAAKKVALEGFLATLLNMAGSIFAINSYMRQLEFFATRDPLTRLYNQRVFWELFGYEVQRAKRHNYKFALFVIDIDNFKLVNDTYGHEFGDRFLSEVARQLRRVFRSEDILARYGGDEFCAILPYVDSQGAVSVAKRLIESIRNFYVEAPDGRRVNVTVSVGIVVFPDHGEDPKALFVLADNVMYRAKKLGKNRFLIAGEEDTALFEEETVRKNLLITAALERDKIVPFFQPIVELSSGEVFGYEVLMRIDEGERVVPAAEFIDVAESMGVIHRLDLKVIEKAIRRVKEAGCAPLLFFNLSPKVLIIPEFLDQVREIVKAEGYEKERIVFEITERETVRNIELLKEFVQSLKEEGFKFAVDDFGSGFASFTYLKRLPIDFIKIEGDFVRGVATSTIDRAFVESAVSMAKVLGIRTVAEFVEDGSTLEIVRSIGVDLVQGFYVGMPSEKVCNGVILKR